MTAHSNARLKDLEQRFSELEPKLQDSPEKEAISILHAMLHESRRQQASAQAAPVGVAHGDQSQAVTLEDIANLYKSAPAMNGKAENKGLSVGTPAPDFALLGPNGNEIKLSDYRGRNVVLVF